MQAVRPAIPRQMTITHHKMGAKKGYFKGSTEM